MLAIAQIEAGGAGAADIARDHNSIAIDQRDLERKVLQELAAARPQGYVELLGVTRIGIADVEKRLIESTLEAAGGVQKKAAELLGIKPTTLNEMIKRYEIGPRRKKASGADDEGQAPGRSRVGGPSTTTSQE